MATAVINARIDSSTKEEATAILKSLGLNPTQVISMLFKQIVYTKSVPFSIELPRKETLMAINELESGRGAKFNSVEDLFEDLNS